MARSAAKLPSKRAVKGATKAPAGGYLVQPDPLDPRLTERVTGVDQTGAKIETRVTVERALTIFLNAQEIVTAMTIGDYPDYLAIGYLLNQNMLKPDDVVTGVDYDEELAVVVVRTRRKTNYEKKLKKKVQTSGCAQGTVFGDLMEALENVKLPDAELRTSWLYSLTNTINTTPSLYLEAGAIHGCVLAQEDRPLVYMEDVGRHNAVDKIAGWMFKHRVRPDDKLFYTTGRLTSEMVIKTVRMGIPIFISRSGFTAWGVELARKANLTLIGARAASALSRSRAKSASCSTRTCATSRRRAPNTGARRRRATSELVDQCQRSGLRRALLRPLPLRERAAPASQHIRTGEGSSSQEAFLTKRTPHPIANSSHHHHALSRKGRGRNNKHLMRGQCCRRPR